MAVNILELSKINATRALAETVHQSIPDGATAFPVYDKRPYFSAINSIRFAYFKKLPDGLHQAFPRSLSQTSPAFRKASRKHKI